MSKQIPLPLSLARHARFETFVMGANSAVVARLRAADSPESLWLWGAPGVGKSHLLQSACAARPERRAIYLPLAGRNALEPAILDGLATMELIAIDDVEAVADSPDWNRALFRLFNEQQESGAQLVLAARSPPSALDFSLADLASRVRALLVYELVPLDDPGLLTAIRVQADARGLELTEAAARYLLARVRRDMTGLSRWLERLDNASLASQRKLTIPLIRETLSKEGV